jgi:hypothetical protein
MNALRSILGAALLLLLLLLALGVQGQVPDTLTPSAPVTVVLARVASMPDTVCHAALRGHDPVMAAAQCWKALVERTAWLQVKDSTLTPAIAWWSLRSAWWASAAATCFNQGHSSWPDCEKLTWTAALGLVPSWVNRLPAGWTGTDALGNRLGR